ncbi:MAG TPA: SDR family oxidoreductase [Candidatus Acidoferrales bacterium]|nr:SDR family oxidoreductase [Candidatus Acidoferrales bacterium]
MEIRGKTAIVTGSGGGGQGRALAIRLAKEGASVVVSDTDVAGGNETLRRIQTAGGRAAFCHADVSSEQDLRGLIAFAEQTFGGLDILVNNAGPFLPGEPLAHWEETLRGNLFSAIHGMLYAIEAMRKRGGGAIICYGSTSAIGYGRKHSPAPAYDVAKIAVARLATTMAWLHQKENIRINCIVPDWVATEEVQAFVDSCTPEQRRARGVPHTLISLDEISTAVMRLIADDSLPAAC